MDRTTVDWRGYWVAAPTPFTADGALDETAWAELVELYAGQGVHGLLVNGSTGEWFSQSTDERHRVVEIAVDTARGRLPVVAGVSAYTRGEAAALAEHAAAVRADGVLATPPPYVHPSAQEILAFYAAVSGATDLPFMVYNWPRGVSVDIDDTPGLAQRLADLENVVAIKDSTGDWMKMLGTVEAVRDRVRVFGSFLHRRGLAVLLGLGGDGNIDGGGVGAPFAVPFYEAVFAGDRAAAEGFADQYQAVSGRLVNPDYSGVFASPIAQLKAAMDLLGQPGGVVREPLLPLEDAGALTAIRRILTDGGLLDVTSPITLTVDGREVRALDGMTLSAVLLSSGVRAVRTNPVSGRPRGAFCGMGVCFECEVVVDGRVARACLTPVTDGLEVETEQPA